MRPHLIVFLAAGCIAAVPHAQGPAQGGADKLIGRAVLPAQTFAPGPTSGALLGAGPIHGVPVPFVDQQPVQGLSAIAAGPHGLFYAMCDNGFGGIENSSDFHLRLYAIRPAFEGAAGGPGTIGVGRFIELRDPDHKVPFAIVNHFTDERILTGADFDIESLQIAPDGTLWIGDEFGPFLLHADRTGRLLDAPIPLPDFETGLELRSPQNPFTEEGCDVRIMNAVRTHARLHGNTKTPVFSPWSVMLADQDPATFVENRTAPPAGSGLVPASSEIFDVASLHAAGYPVVPYTVNDEPGMQALLKLGVDGLISDRPDLLYAAVAAFDADGDGTAGDLIGPDGLIDGAEIEAQGHRGARGLRPENTLPAMEAGLDNLVTTLETDCGITADFVAVLDHDPLVQSSKARKADGTPYGEADEVLLKDITLAELQSTFICDVLLPGQPAQTNDLALSPVSVAFAAGAGMHPYAMPALEQLFAFVDFYAAYYHTGPGASHPDAERRWKNAERVRFNVETKINPRHEFEDLTWGVDAFVEEVSGTIAAEGMQERADVQSFDFRTLLGTHETFPAIRTVFLFGDFPVYADPSLAGSDDGTNLQDEEGANTPWLAGLAWPYRSTALSNPLRVAQSGGFEGMALTPDGRTLLPLLERPLAGGEPNVLLIHAFDLASQAYTGAQYRYPLDPKGTNIGDFVLHTADVGLVIERDGTQGDLSGFKAVFEVRLHAPGELVSKALAVDLMDVADPDLISLPAAPGDVGLGDPFAFPFTTIEDVVILGPQRIGILNDNNFPFSVGRHVGSDLPDDTEFIVLELDQPLGAYTSGL